MPKRAVRIHPELDQRMQNATRERGYRSTQANFDRLARELRRALRGQQAIFALPDAFTKIFLACVPEPPSDARAQSISMARERHMRLIKTAGQSLTNESAMQGLLGDEND